jgi:hypothetical protein
MDPLRWRILVALWPSRYRIIDDGFSGRALVAEDLEDWLWKRLPYRLYMFVANTHDMLPFTKGEWSADEDGFVR